MIIEFSCRYIISIFHNGSTIFPKNNLVALNLMGYWQRLLIEGISMRNATNIRICNNEVILHKLDPKQQNEGTVISSRALSLVGRESLGNFFRGHIQNGLKDSSSKAARFRFISKNLPSGLCSRLISSEIHLIPGSQELARNLDDVMSKNHQISSGDLAVCLFEADGIHGNHVALLKIDPSEGFIQKILYDDDGNPFIDIQLQQDNLPSAQERLQKCAFIHSLNPRDGFYDMLLLDRQSSADEGKQIARFFISDFLDAEYAMDSTQRTQRLYEALVSARSQIRTLLTTDELENFDDQIRNAVRSDSINLDVWIEQLPIGAGNKLNVNQVLLSYLPDREFELDRNLGEKLSGKRRFRAEYDFRLSLTADGYKRIVKEDKWIEDENHNQRHRLVIETEQWDEISKPR